MHKNLYDNVSLEKVATELHFNKSYLARLFKKEMNETIGEFILREKVEEAKRLLMVSKHSLLDISVLLHFNDQSHFTKVFKQFVGLTPKKYRDQHQFKG
ncbi:helix-turn-helix transcriptional regulator [Turicibacter sanguinis]|uniref:helix-turn-helix transcriptional regulator n=1 Tax=Turicibacter sanguinis TaxID=154288 RepID=UPI0022AAB5D3|nr:helix-turn-helix transcriptional regulator [Turicibacter sanguinis]